MLRKRWTIEFESLPFNSIYSKRKSTKIIPCASSGAEGETRQGKPCLACFASSPIFCPFLLRKKMDYRVRVSPLQFHLLKKKKHKDNSLCFFWRGRRDSTGQALSCLLRKLSHFLSLFATQKDGLPSSSLSPSIPSTQKEKAQR